MKLVTRNAENQLYAKAQLLSERHDSWRCIHINLYRKRGVYSQQLITYFYINPIKDMMEELDGDIFICRDGDIFILFQGLTTPVIDRLVTHFGELNADKAEGEENLFTLLDLSMHWQAFFGLCRLKASRTLSEPAASFGRRTLAVQTAGAMQ